MPFIYSTLSTDQQYRGYTKGGGDMPIVSTKVFIAGKANIMNKNIITPRGMVTEVTEEELKVLEADEVFKIHVKGGFISVDKKQVDAEKAAENMSAKDKSAPITPDDYEAGKAPTVVN